MNISMLTVVIFLPALGALCIALFVNKANENAIKWIANIVAFVDFALSLTLLRGFDAASTQLQHVTQVSWIEAIGVEFFIGLDGISLLLVILTTGLGFISVMSFVLLFLTGKLMVWAVARFGEGWGFTELHDIASMPLFAVALSFLLIFTQPLLNAFSRTIEHDSDIFALEMTHANDAGARAFLKLGSQNKADPDPSRLEVIWLYSHPPVSERVQFMLDYKPWETGEPNKLWKE